MPRDIPFPGKTKGGYVRVFAALGIRDAYKISRIRVSLSNLLYLFYFIWNINLTLFFFLYFLFLFVFVLKQIVRSKCHGENHERIVKRIERAIPELKRCVERWGAQELLKQYLQNKAKYSKSIFFAYFFLFYPVKLNTLFRKKARRGRRRGRRWRWRSRRWRSSRWRRRRWWSRTTRTTTTTTTTTTTRATTRTTTRRRRTTTTTTTRTTTTRTTTTRVCSGDNSSSSRRKRGWRRGIVNTTYFRTFFTKIKIIVLKKLFISLWININTK